MRSIVVFLCFALTSGAFGATVKVKTRLDGKSIITAKENFQQVEAKLYNPWRKVTKTYVGVDFFEFMDGRFGKTWRNAKRVRFVALDGYTQQVEVVKLLKDAQGRRGIIASGERNLETGKLQGLGTFQRKQKKTGEMKTIVLGPSYLVWTGASTDKTAKHSDSLKWPYQLSKIEVLN